MGYGNYDSDAYKSITTSRVDKSREQIFRQKKIDKEMDPKGLKFRESRDSKNHPNSVGIIFALDETGSMREIPDYLARQELPQFMDVILEGKFVADPQVLFMGIGDATTGEPAPLQVGQFESEAELMDKWLTRIFLVGNGGGNEGESYGHAFYAAARHTAMDCWEKRGKKGYLFVTGDEPPLSTVDKESVRDLIGTKLGEDVSMAQAIKEAEKTFNCFFLIPDQDRRRYNDCETVWRRLLGDRVICLDTHRDTCLTAATLIGLTEGTLKDLNAAAAKLVSMGKSQEQVARVIKAVTPYAKTLPADRNQDKPKKGQSGSEGPKTGGGGKPGGKKPGRI